MRPQPFTLNPIAFEQRDSEGEMSLPYPPDELLARTFLGMKSNFPKTEYVWIAVKRTFSVGSRSAVQICEHFKINPYGEIQELEIQHFAQSPRITAAGTDRQTPAL